MPGAVHDFFCQIHFLPGINSQSQSLNETNLGSCDHAHDAHDPRNNLEIHMRGKAGDQKCILCLAFAKDAHRRPNMDQHGLTWINMELGQGQGKKNTLPPSVNIHCWTCLFAFSADAFEGSYPISVHDFFILCILIIFSINLHRCEVASVQKTAFHALLYKYASYKSCSTN